jgi:uncharacterized protein YdhG (YjbR/CyaY superfamily)
MVVPGTYKRYGSAESQYGTIGFPQHEQVAYGLLDRKNDERRCASAGG